MSPFGPQEVPKEALKDGQIWKNFIFLSFVQFFHEI